MIGPVDVDPPASLAARAAGGPCAAASTRRSTTDA